MSSNTVVGPVQSGTLRPHEFASSSVTVEITREPAERYPFWCWDKGTNTEDRYLGHFTTKVMAEARARLLNVPEGQWTLRKCRQVSAVELLPQGYLDDILERLEEQAVDSMPEAWGDWESALVDAKEGAVAALERWAKSYLETKLVICEGDE